MTSELPSKPTLILFDAHHYLHRAYHALPALSTNQGESVGAVYGFIRTIMKILKRFPDAYFAVCWDTKPTERLSVDAAYKATRPAAPGDLKSQIAVAKHFVETWGMASVEVQGQEADDVMATLADKASRRGFTVVLISSDKDMFQLVKDGVTIYLEHKDELVDGGSVLKKYGVESKTLVDYFALTGDATDNVPGVPGVGPKTAKVLIGQWGSVDALISQAKDPASALEPRLRKKILENEERLKSNLKLVRLRGDLPLDFEPERFRLGKKACADFQTLLIRLGFASILGDLRQMGWAFDQMPCVKDANHGQESAAGEVSQVSQAEGFDAWKKKAFCIEEEGREAQSLDSVVSNPDIIKVVFDWKTHLHRQPSWSQIAAGTIIDVKIAAWLADPTESSYESQWLLTKYGASTLKELAFALNQELGRQGLCELYESLELPLISVLFDMEGVGIAVDKPFLEKLGRQWLGDLEKLRKEFVELSQAEESINLNSPKQLAFVLFEKMKLPAVKKIKTGYSTNEEVLQKLKGLHPAVGKLLDFRELSKLHSTYIEGLLEAISSQTGKIHATFHQDGTQTGRLSCSNPNLQNIPIRSERGLIIRRAFTASKPGWELISLDYSQIDLRVFAHLSQDKQLKDFFCQGRDIHEETARTLLAGGANVTPDMRRRAKAINFGILYGMGVWGLAATLNIPEHEAEEFINLYYSRFPGVWAWRQKTIDGARQKGWVSTILGRRRPLANINSPNRNLREFSERAAVNTPVQGSSADIIKVAMIRLYEYIRKHALSSRLLVQVHDEILIEGPSQEIQAHQEAWRQIMQDAMRLEVPLVAHVKKGPNWADLEPIG